MIAAGDEMGRSQRGNNNAYCQDNDLSWVDWTLDERRKALLEFTARMATLRKGEGVLREDWFFQGDHIFDSRFKDLAFFRSDGKEMSDADWHDDQIRCFGYLLGGDTLVVPNRAGHRPVGDTLLMLLNSHHEDLTFTLPDLGGVRSWEMVAETAAPEAGSRRVAEREVVIQGRSLSILRLRPAEGSKLEAVR
jgi:glycogen operon protein